MIRLSCTPSISARVESRRHSSVVPRRNGASRHTGTAGTAAPLVRGRDRTGRRALRALANLDWDAIGHTYSATVPDRAASADAVVKQYDFLVIGSGIAGLSYALKVAEYGRVAIVTKDYANEGCTQYAQGGVCAVLDANDSVESHVRDTIIAGAYLNDPKAVDVVCREGPPRVLELVRLGAEFTRNTDGSLHLTREGGHSARRIVHAADLTGAEVERALLAAARAHPSVTFYEHHLAIDLVVGAANGAQHCFGADVLDQRRGAVCRVIALATMLASGGAGQVYPHTTNPHVATGDGIAMAFRATATVSNMEFVQFHPTALYDAATPAARAAGAAGATACGDGRCFLITEALRGEGAHLYNLAGERFMSSYDAERMELAPRDVVARAIHDQMLTRNEQHMWLDISHKPSSEVLSHFPNIAKKCAELGVDITRDPIPVTPAQHYMCGGVSTGLRGETSVQGLFACGEVACSGLHGANRLASNSLLEGLVFADRAAGPSVAHAEYAARACGPQLQTAAASAAAEHCGPRVAAPLPAAAAAWVAAKREEVRALMWRSAGIVRRSAALAAAQRSLAAASTEAAQLLASFGVSTPLVELVNVITIGELIVSCALQRRESRGLHYSADFPTTLPVARPSVVSTALRERAAGPLPSAPGTPPLVPTALRAGGASSAVPGGGMSSKPGGSAGGKKSKARDLSVRSTAEE